jgi:hypothetical protein
MLKLSVYTPSLENAVPTVLVEKPPISIPEAA